jgi:prevent-host-death family protein
MEEEMGKLGPTWQIRDARANFSTLVDKAVSEGPQIVTRNGKKVVVVVAADEWAHRADRRDDLVEFFANSPLREEGIEIEGIHDYPRELKL